MIIVPMRCCMAANRSGAVNAVCVGHDARMIWAAEINALARSSKARALRLVRLYRLLNLIDREAGNFAAVIAAELLQRRHPAMSSAERTGPA